MAALEAASKSVICEWGIAILLLEALVICPCAFTLIIGICTRLPYVPADTPVFVILIAPLLNVIPVLPLKSENNNMFWSVPALLNCHLSAVSFHFKYLVPLERTTFICASPSLTAPCLNVMFVSSTNKSTCVAELIFAVTFKLP